VYGYSNNKEGLLGRLKRIEGQIRGIQRMVEGDEYCIDILTQISAASNALKKVAVALLHDHIGHCVVEGVASGGEEGRDVVAEASEAIERLVKS
jgi:CsoR family transcriptional regulator, copper-sensing transcriptional repressor